MSRIITFLGQSGESHPVLAVGMAKWFAQQGQKVLLVSHNPAAQVEHLLQTSLTSSCQTIAPNLDAVQLQSTAMLEQVWEQLKQLLSQYLPSGLSEGIYPGELIILPGFDSLLTFNALREYFTSNAYDVILYVGRGDLETLRLLSGPEALAWYFRRFRQALEALDLSKIAASLGGPIASAVLAANVDSQKIHQGLEQVHTWVDQGMAVVGDARRLTAYLVTTTAAAAIAEARWLWGSAQQASLVVSGVLVYPPATMDELELLKQSFTPLPLHEIPKLEGEDWQPLLKAMPDLNAIPAVPQPLTIDVAQREVRVFLPGFNRNQVKLTQYGSELTVEAGDQRRNIVLPPELQGLPVQGGKFEEPYLLISL